MSVWNNKDIALVYFYGFREMSKRCLIKVLKWHLESDVLQMSPECQFWTFFTESISVIWFSNLVYQMCVLNIKNLVFAYSFRFGETS